MAVIHALGYKQVGGYADEAADAASSPARCARGRLRQARAPNKATTQQRNAQKSAAARGVAAEPLGDHSRAYRRAVLSFHLFSRFLPKWQLDVCLSFIQVKE